MCSASPPCNAPLAPPTVPIHVKPRNPVPVYPFSPFSLLLPLPVVKSSSRLPHSFAAPTPPSLASMQVQVDTPTPDRKHRFGSDFTKKISSFFRSKSSSTRQKQRQHQHDHSAPPPRASRNPSARNDQTPRSMRFKLFAAPTHPKEPVSFSVPSSHIRNGTITDALPSYLRSKQSHHELDMSAPRSAPPRAFPISRLPGLPNSHSKRSASDNRSPNLTPQSQNPSVDPLASSTDIQNSFPSPTRQRSARVISKDSSTPVPQPYRPTDQSPFTKSGLPSTRSSPIVSRHHPNALHLRYETDRQVLSPRHRSDTVEIPSGSTLHMPRSQEASEIIRPVPQKPNSPELRSKSASQPHLPRHAIPPTHITEPASWDPTSSDKAVRVPSRNLRALHEIEAQVKHHTDDRYKDDQPDMPSRHRNNDKRYYDSQKQADVDTDGEDTSSLSSAPTTVVAGAPSFRHLGVNKKELLTGEPVSTSFSSPVEEYKALSPQGEQAAQALERISRIIGDFDEGGDEKGKESVIPILMEAINQYRHDPLVADRALTTLRRFIVSPKCRRALGESGAVETIASIMNTHNLRVRIAAQGCLALGNLCYHEDGNKDRVLEHGITVIVAAMALHTEAEQTQAWGALALRNCTSSLDEEAEGPLGAVEVLVAALERYTRSDVVVSNSLAALSNIARTKGKDAIVQAGGVSVLLTTLRTNFRNQKLSELGLSLCVGVIEDDAICAFFGDQGGVETVTSILEYHKGDAAISCLGSAVLRVLAFNAQNRKRFANCGTLRAVVAALSTVAAEEAPGNVNVVMKALANVAFDSESMRVDAGKLRVIELTMSIMLRLSKSELVAEAGMRVIRNLTDQNKDNGAVLIGHPQGLTNIAWIGRTHGTSSSGVAEHTIACLVNLSVTRRFAAVIKANLSIEKLVQDLRSAHSSNRTVVGQALKLKSILDATSKPRSTTRD